MFATESIILKTTLTRGSAPQSGTRNLLCWRKQLHKHNFKLLTVGIARGRLDIRKASDLKRKTSIIVIASGSINSGHHAIIHSRRQSNLALPRALAWGALYVENLNTQIWTKKSECLVPRKIPLAWYLTNTFVRTTTSLNYAQRRRIFSSTPLG